MSELRTKGYTGFRVDKVAVAAEVSRGAQTHHFPTKEQLVLAALESLYITATTASLKLAESTGQDDDVLSRMMDDAGRFYLSPHFTIALSMLNLGDHESELRKKVQAMSRKYRLPIEQAWQAAFIRSGLDEQIARTILDLTFAVYRGLVMRRFLRRTGDDTKATLAQWALIARAYINGAIAD